MPDSIAALQPIVQRIVVSASARRPVLVGLDGPVAVGKSTLARSLAEALGREGLTAAVVSADGFLWPAAELQARSLMARKGFPESFDRQAMAAFLGAVRAGQAPSAPSYAHAAYDVSETERQLTGDPAVVIFEGVNVLAPDLRGLYDLALYLDAEPTSVRRWFAERFAATPFGSARAAALAPWRPESGDVAAWSAAVWEAVNAPNWRRHVAAGRVNADMVIRKTDDHRLAPV